MGILDEYSDEITEIQNELSLIKKGNVRDLVGSGAYLSTRALKVEEILNEMLNRIDKGLPSKSSLAKKEIFKEK